MFLNNISGDSPEKTLGRLLKSLRHIYADLADEYLKLASNTSKNNIKKLLIEFSEEARQDSLKIDEIINSKMANFEVSDEDISMLSHITVMDSNLDDEEKLIFDAIKTSDNLQGLYGLIKEEYENNEIKEIFDTLIKHENSRKNELRKLYEDIIVKGEW